MQAVKTGKVAYTFIMTLSDAMERAAAFMEAGAPAIEIMTMTQSTPTVRRLIVTVPYTLPTELNPVMKYCINKDEWLPTLIQCGDAVTVKLYNTRVPCEVVNTRVTTTKDGHCNTEYFVRNSTTWTMGMWVDQAAVSAI